MISRNDIRNALVRGYCGEHNKAKPIDLELVDAMLDEVMVAISVAMQREDYLRKVSISDDRHPTAS
jgi:hypothetical protein